MALDLTTIRTTGGKPLPPRIVIHGPHGIGKSTFGACAPAPIFVPTEDGLTGLTVDAFPLAKTLDDVMDALRTLATEPHTYRTVVLDSADWLEAIVWAATAAEHGHKSIEDFGYGKGYVFALDRWRKLLGALDYLRTNRAMATVLLCHTEIRRFDSPETDPYDRYQLKLHKSASAILQEWADVVGFANYRVLTKEKDVGFNKKATRGVGTGERLLHYHERPAFAAKTRYAMPASTDLTWADFATAFVAATTDQSTETETTEQVEIKTNG